MNIFGRNRSAKRNEAAALLRRPADFHPDAPPRPPINAGEELGAPLGPGAADDTGLTDTRRDGAQIEPPAEMTLERRAAIRSELAEIVAKIESRLEAQAQATSAPPIAAVPEQPLNKMAASQDDSAAFDEAMRDALMVLDSFKASRA